MSVSDLFLNTFYISNLNIDRFYPNVMRYYDESIYTSYEDALTNDITLQNNLKAGKIRFWNLSRILQILYNDEILRNKLIAFAFKTEKYYNFYNNQKISCPGYFVNWDATYNIRFGTTIEFIPASEVDIPFQTMVAIYNISSNYTLSINTSNELTDSKKISGYLQFFNYMVYPKLTKKFVVKGSDINYFALATFECLYQAAKMKIQSLYLGLPKPYDILFTPQLAKRIYNEYNPIVITRVNSTLGKVVGSNLQW